MKLTGGDKELVGGKMKVIEINEKGEPSGWRQGRSLMFRERLSDGRYYYLVIKEFPRDNNGSNVVTVATTVNKFKEGKKLLYEL
jgi:hypothetical protein